MKRKEEELPALRELEAAVLGVWKQHPGMTDHAASRAYENAFQHQRARFRGQEPKPHSLSGIDLEAFTAVQRSCDKLLNQGAEPIKNTPMGNTDPLSLEKLVECLRELQRSVGRHTRLGGRQGYLEFIRRFMP